MFFAIRPIWPEIFAKNGWKTLFSKFNCLNEYVADLAETFSNTSLFQQKNSLTQTLSLFWFLAQFLLPTLIFYLFKELERKSNREDLMDKLDSLYRSYRVCSDNFEAKMSHNKSRNRLILDASPALFPTLEGPSGH